MTRTGNTTAEHVRTARELGNKAKQELERRQNGGRASIKEHEGKKYLREIRCATNPDEYFDVDVYAVLVAFNVTCPATAHALKKLLCAGQRDKGDAKTDLIGAIAAINRAIDLLEE